MQIAAIYLKTQRLCLGFSPYHLRFLSFGLMLFFSAWCANTMSAQPALPNVFHLTEKDGLGTRLYPSIVEDKKRGFIWIGAKSGIWRYDGETVVKGWPKPKKDALTTDTYLAVTVFLADSRGDVWFYDEKKNASEDCHLLRGRCSLFMSGQQDGIRPSIFPSLFTSAGCMKTARDEFGQIHFHMASFYLMKKKPVS